MCQNFGMARPLRLELPDALWHVTARGNERKPVFRDEHDYETFLDVLGAVVARFGWRLHAYVLMPNHYHLVFTTPLPTLSKGMRQLGGVYTQRFNKRWSRSGHLFQGRFFSLHVERDAHLLELLRYTALNPVRARLVEDPGAWRWSSYRATAGIEPPPPFLDASFVRDQFRSRRGSPGRAFQEFVRTAVPYDPWEEVRHQVFLGSEEFFAGRLSEVRERKPTTGIPARQVRGAGLTVGEAWRKLCGAPGTTDVSMRTRDLVCLLLHEDVFATYREVGACAGLTEWGARSAVDRGRARALRERAAQRELGALRRTLGGERGAG